MKGWTRHGHRIEGVAQVGIPPAVARCGGPGLCAGCSKDAARERGSVLDNGEPDYVRQLEDAVLVLWAEMPTAEVLRLREDAPALVDFVRHLHHSIEHEQAMVRQNYWAAVDRG